jgi:hypothetical protein
MFRQVLHSAHHAHRVEYPSCQHGVVVHQPHNVPIRRAGEVLDEGNRRVAGADHENRLALAAIGAEQAMFLPGTVCNAVPAHDHQ